MGERLRVTAAALAALALSGCAIVDVHTPDGRAHLSAWPGGVRIDKGNATAVSTTIVSVGAVFGSTFAGVGIQRIEETDIDPRACSAAIIHANTENPDLLDTLSHGAAVECPDHKKEDHQ